MGAQKAETVKSWRKSAIDVMTDALNTYGAAAASAACDLFDDVMELEGLSVTASMPSGIYSHEEIEKIARYQAGKIRRDDVDGFLDQVSKSTGFLTYQGGNRSMLWQSGWYSSGHATSTEMAYSANGSADVEVRYARIPQGAETCNFCLMLASRGFVYVTPDTASHSHRNCDCIVVPGVGHHDPDSTPTSMGDWVQDTTVDGFDVEDLRSLLAKWQEIDPKNVSSMDDELTRRKLEAMRDVLGRDSW